MLLSAHRPQHRIGELAFQPHSLEEENVRLIAVVTEGSKEELIYLKGYVEKLEKQNGKRAQVHFLNDFISEEIIATENQASHPLRRLQLLKEYLSLRNPDFQRRPDESWLVCDRDNLSFSETQYDEVCGYCQSHNINFVISNPAFQLWLLLHFDSWLRDSLYEDHLSCPEQLKIIEQRLSQVLPYYRHGSLHFANYVRYVSRAVENSRRYCTDVGQLKFEIGTNFAQLIVSLQQCFAK